MKTLLIVSVLCFVGSHAKVLMQLDDNVRNCIMEYAMNENMLRAPRPTSIDEGFKNKEFNCLLACIMKAKLKSDNIYETLKTLINLAALENESKDFKKQLTDKLETCNTQVGRNDCKLIQCLDFSVAPYKNLYSSSMY